MSKPEMARPVGTKRRKFPWIALVLLLGSIYAFWILPWQINGQKEFIGPKAAPEVQTNYVKQAQPPAVKKPDAPEVSGQENSQDQKTQP